MSIKKPSEVNKLIPGDLIIGVWAGRPAFELVLFDIHFADWDGEWHYPREKESPTFPFIDIDARSVLLDEVSFIKEFVDGVI